MAVQVAISKSGFVRAVQTGATTFEVQALAIRGQHRIGQSPFWKKICTVWDCDKAVAFMHDWAGAAA